MTKEFPRGLKPAPAVKASKTRDSASTEHDYTSQASLGGKKKCTKSGCDKFAQRGGLCIKHGAVVIRKKYPCKHQGCEKHSRAGGFCVAHGGNRLPKMTTTATMATTTMTTMSTMPTMKTMTKKKKKKIGLKGWVGGGVGAGVGRPKCRHGRCSKFARSGKKGFCIIHFKKDRRLKGCMEESEEEEEEE